MADRHALIRLLLKIWRMASRGGASRLLLIAYPRFALLGTRGRCAFFPYALNPASYSNLCSNFASTSRVAPGLAMCKAMT